MIFHSFEPEDHWDRGGGYDGNLGDDGFDKGGWRDVISQVQETEFLQVAPVLQRGLQGIHVCAH